MRRFALLTVTLLVLGACGGSSGGDRGDAAAETTERTDAAGNVIPEGFDWSGVGDPLAAHDDATDPGDPAAGGAVAGSDDGEAIDCGVPEPPEYDEQHAPPGFDPEAPLSEPDNDFPLTASIDPERGDPGTEVTIDVMAVGQPEALAVIVARFFDRDHHGMRAAKFTDLTGRAQFVGPIPESAPMGIVNVVVSVSNEDGESALTTLDFIVTGPGCP